VRAKVGKSITMWLRLVATGLAFLALGLGCFSLRRGFIATWFRDATPAPPPTMPQPASSPATTATKLRVLLIDGLGQAEAQTLPALSRLCASGLDLTVDVGFPTVSLPVQAVLWTGRTQAQLGLLYRIKPLDQVPSGSLPARLSDSIAVAEDQAFIAGSFGFAQVLPALPVLPTLSTSPPPLPVLPDPAWANAGFPPAAERAVASNASLAFVHVLRVDKAGHKKGAASPEYGAATIWADDLLDRLVRAAPVRDDQRWVVLSDHGHSARGGHAGRESTIRIVRACVAGGALLPPQGATTGEQPIHLVDLARLLIDTVGLSPPAEAVGRPLAFARSHPAPRATLPAPDWGRDLLAFAIVLLPLFAARAVVRRHSRQRHCSPWPALAIWLWLPIALAGVFLIRGAPSLSTPAIYPPQGRDLWLAGLPGLLALAASLIALSFPSADQRWRPTTALPPCLLATIALLPGLMLALATLYACGALTPLLDKAAGPPLSPHATPLASMALALEGAAALLCAVLVPVIDVVRWSRQRRHSANPAPASHPGRTRRPEA
jgi:hypothetical protein